MSAQEQGDTRDPCNGPAMSTPRGAGQAWDQRLNLLSRPERKTLAIASLVSVLAHVALLGLTFGGQDFGLPGFDLPWRERRIAAPDLHVVLAPGPTPAVGSVAPAAPLAESLPPQTTLEPPLDPSEPAAALTRVEAPAPPPATAIDAAEPEPMVAAPPDDQAPSEEAVATTERRLADMGDTAAALGVQPDLIAVHQPGLARWVAPPVPPVPNRAISTAPSASSPQAPQPAAPVAAVPARPQASAPEQAQERARLEQQALLARQQAQQREAGRAEAARLQAERLEEARQAAAARHEREQLEAQRKEADRLAAARAEAERQALALQEAARLELARQEAERQEAARQLAARQELLRQEQLRQEAVRLDAARIEAERQEKAQKAAAEEAAARQRAAQIEADEARREAARRAMGRQLDEEAARRDAAAAAARSPGLLPPSASSMRRGRLLGRSDPNAELVLYAEAWARKIQLNVAIESVRELVSRPHANPVVTVALRRDGTVESISFVVSSGVAELDEGIRRIVQAQAPYQAFSPALAGEYDVIEIRRTWYFDSAVRLY
jgi:membrane protein involved in colicin uptake